MRIYRFDRPLILKPCWQRSIASICSLPTFNDEIRYILSELPQYEKKYWVFGFTKLQFVNACRIFKRQLKFCSDKSITKWNKECKLKVYEISEKYIYDFNDQVLFKLNS